MPSSKYSDKYKEYNDKQYIKQQEKITTCECGASVMTMAFKKHLATKRHNILIDRINKKNAYISPFD